MQEPLISIVVPVYRVEPYLDRCVESLCRQSYRRLEILLVDDGSPDRCGELCDAWALRDERIRVLHKENGGLSDARNQGVALATGDYISFVDSDDYLAPDAMAYLLSLLEEGDADVAVGGYRVVHGDGEAFADQPPESRVHLSPREACRSLMGGAHYMDLVTAWGKLFPASLVRSHPFPRGRIHEDEATTYLYYYQCRGVALGKREIYAYYQNPSSITHTRNERNQRAVLQAFQEQCAFFRQQGDPELAAAAADRMINVAVHCACLGEQVWADYLRHRDDEASRGLPLRFKTRVQLACYRLTGRNLRELYHALQKN